MPLLRLANRRKGGNEGEIGKLDYRIGNTAVGQGVFLTGATSPIPVEVDEDVVWDDNESITVSSTAVGLTESKAVAHAVAFITVEAAAVRYWITGTPTATAGHNLDPGDVLTLRGTHNLDQVSFIRRNGIDATLRVSYGNRR